MFTWLNKILHKPDQRQLVEALQSLAALHELEIVADKRLVENTITHTELRAGRLEAACLLLTNELAIYPSDIIKKSRLSRIFLVSELRHQTKKVGGLFTSSGNTIFLSLDQLGTNEGQKRGFHHELFHCIDYYDDLLRHRDPSWEHLNNPPFAYSAEWNTQVDACISYNGFITNYSMTAVQEDKAELYSHMIVHFKDLQVLAQYDHVLKKKMSRMERLLSNFSGKYDLSFWRQRNDDSKFFSVPSRTDAVLEITGHKVGAKDIFTAELKTSVLSSLLIGGRVEFKDFPSLVTCLMDVCDISQAEIKETLARQKRVVKVQCKTKVLERYKLGRH